MIDATAPTPLFTCGEAVTLGGNSPGGLGTGQWRKVIPTASGVITTTNMSNAVVTGINYGSTLALVWTITSNAGGCVSSTNVSITNDGFSVYAGENDTICSDSKLMNAEQPGSGTGEWLLVGGAGTPTVSSDYNTEITGLGSGDNVFSWTITRGSCSNSSQVRIYNALPSDAVISNVNADFGNESCDGTVRLTAVTPTVGNGYWNQSAGSGLVGTSSLNPLNVVGLSANNNKFVWEVTNVVGSTTCSNSVDTIIINNQVLSEAGPDQNICQNVTQLHAIDPLTTTYGADSYYWTNESGGAITIDEVSNFETYVRNLPVTTSTFRWTVTKGNCVIFDDVEVTNNEITATSSDQTVCDNYATLQGNAYTAPAESGYWTIGAPNTATFATPSLFTNNVCDVNNLSEGTNAFTWHLERDICSDEATIYITYNNLEISADPEDLVNICEDTYTLRGDNPSPGTGVWTKITGSGIIQNNSQYNSIVTNLDENPTRLKWTVYKNNCVASDQVAIFNNGVVASATTNFVTCTGSVNLDGNNPSPGTGEWIKVVPTSSGDIIWSSMSNATVSNIDEETTIALKWVLTSAVGNCKDSVQVSITNNQFSVSAGDPATTCSDSIQLDADDIGSGQWINIGGGGVIANTADAETWVTNLNQGDNIFQWTVEQNNCQAVNSVTITNNSVNADAGSDQLDLCVDFTTLDGNDPITEHATATGIWTRMTGGGDITSSLDYNSGLTNLSRTSSTFRWTVYANGCDDYDDVVIRNNAFDVFAGINDTICSDQTNLAAFTVVGGSGLWSPQGVTPASIITPSDANSEVTGLQQGDNNFRWTVIKDGCSFFDDVLIVNDLPDVPILVSSDIIVCENIVDLHAIDPNTAVTGTTGQWSYTGVGGDINAANNAITYADNLNFGITEFIWTVTHNDCNLSDSFFAINDEITSNAGGNIDNLCVDYVSLNALAPTEPATGWWEKADAQPGIIADISQNVTDVTGLGYNENKFVWFVQNTNCMASDTVIVINNSASDAQVGNMPPVCSTTTTLSATPPSQTTEIGVWNYIVDPVDIVNPSASNTQVNDLVNGANVFTWTVTNTTPYATCSDDTTFTVISNYFIIDAGADQVLCENTTNLEGETRPSMTSQYWEIITGTPIIANSTDENSLITLEQGTSTVLTWTVIENGCSDSDMVILKNKEVIPVAYNDEVCTSTEQINAVPPGIDNSGYWTHATSGIIYTPNNSTHNPTVTGLVLGANQFTWHVVNNPDPTTTTVCEDSTSISINYLVPVALPESATICNDYHTLSANQPPSDGWGEWTLFSGAGDITNATSYNNAVIYNLGQGENKFTWTVYQRGCDKGNIAIITNNKPTISVGATQNLCQSSTTLSGNPLDIGDTGEWIKMTPGNHVIVNSLQYNTEVTGIEGTTIFLWTVSNLSCTASEQLIINNNSIVADAGESISVCENSVQLTATLPANATGEWSSPVQGPEFESNTTSNTWVTNLNSDNNIFIWTIHKNGCEDSDFVIVDNNSVYSFAGDVQNICKNTTTLFGSNLGDGTGVWTKISGSGNIVNPSVNVTALINIGTGANEFMWTVNNEMCEGISKVIINNNEVEADAGAGNAALCNNEADINALLAETGTTGEWAVVGGAGNIENISLASTRVTNLARGENILRWTVTSDQCSKESEIIINNITPTQAITAADRIVCENTTTITANSPNGIGTGHWNKITPITVEIANSLLNSTLVTKLGTGPNKFEWLIMNDAGTCATRDTITIINNSISIQPGFSKPICVDTFRMEASEPQSGIGRWTKISSYGDFDNPTVFNTIVRNIGEGANTYRWTVTTDDCSSSKDIIITNNKPTNAWAGNDDLSCTGCYGLVGTTPDLDETGLWSSIGGVSSAEIVTPSVYYTDVCNMINGANTFVWQITKGSCIDEDTVIITNNKINVDAIGPLEICEDTASIRGNLVIFDSNTSASWSVVGGGGTFDDATNYQTVVRGMSVGANTYRWTITEGLCSNYKDLQIENNRPTTAIVCQDTIKTCLDYVTLCANTPPDGEEGIWSRLAGNGKLTNSNQANTVVFDLGREAQYKWALHKGNCVLSDTVSIINGGVQATVAFSPSEVCGTDGQLSANNPLTGTGLWTTTGTATILTPTAYNSYVEGLQQGDNTFRWTVTHGNCEDYEDMVLVNNVYDASANMSGSNPLCEPEVTVIGNIPPAGSTGQWTICAGDGEFINNSVSTTTAYNLQDGVNTICWTIYKGGCSNTVNFDVENYTVNANAGDDDITVCSATEVRQLMGNVPPDTGTGQWEVISGTVSITNTALNDSEITGVSHGVNNLKWTVYENGCSDEDYILVMNNFFTVTAGSNRIICGESTVLSGTDPESGNGLWSVVSGYGDFDDNMHYTTQVSGMSQGVNTFAWSVTKDGCSGIKEVQIINGNPTAVAGENFATCDSIAELNAANPTIGEGKWSLLGGGGTIVDKSQNQTLVTGLANGANTFRWTVTNIDGGCEAWEDIVVTNNKIPTQIGTVSTCNTTAFIFFNPLSNSTGLWTSISGAGTFTNPSSATTTVNGLNEDINTFNWTVHKNECSAVNVMTVTNNMFYTNAGGDQVVSAPNTDMSALLPEAGQEGTWSIISGAGNFGGGEHAEDATVTDLGYGSNIFRWSVFDSNTGCEAYDDVVINYIGFFLEAGDDQTICSDFTEMEAEVAPDGTIAYWSITSGNCVIEDYDSESTNVTGIEPGILTLRWNAERNGFVTYDEVIINNYSFETNAGDYQQLCIDNTQLDAASVTGNNDLPAGDNWIGVWDIIAGDGIISENSAQNAYITNLDAGQPGRTTLRWTVERTDYPSGETCADTDTVSLFYYQMPIPDFSINPVDADCHPFDVVLKNTTDSDTIKGTEYDWYFDGDIASQPNVPYDTLVNQTFENPTIPYDPDNPILPQDSIYNVTLVSHVRINSTLVCTETNSHPVTVWAVPYVGFDISGHNQPYADPTNIGIENLSSPNFGDDAYAWNFGNGATQPGGFDPFFEHSYFYWGTYTITLTITNEQCSEDSSQTFIIYPPVPKSAGKADHRLECLPYSHQFNANVMFTTPGISQYRWDIKNDGISVAQLTEENPVYNFTESGTYLARLYATGEGSVPEWDYTYIRTDTVTVAEKPVAYFIMEPKRLEGQDTIIRIIVPDPIHCIDQSTDAYTYNWDFGDGSPGSTEQNPMHSYMDDGEYFVTLTVEADNLLKCSDTYTSEYKIEVLPRCELKYPNAFTPNLDGGSGGSVVIGSSDYFRNDVFIPIVTCLEVDEYEMQIYNRWGKLIFVSTDVDVGWDGYIDGKIAPQDVYIYKVKGRYINGHQFKDIDNVTLLR